MFSLENQSELRKATVSSLVTCIYLPIIVTVISYRGSLYSIGQASSSSVLVLIFIAELLKSFYMSSPDKDVRKKAGRHRASDILYSAGFIVGTILCFFIGIILFGAPVMTAHEETLMLSTLLTLLTVFPLTALVGVGNSMQLLFCIKTYAKESIIEMLVNNAIFTVCGAWLGATVIPLDWNRPWQEWPIPCYLGALVGYLLSNVFTILKVTLLSASVKYPSLRILINIMDNFQSK